MSIHININYQRNPKEITLPYSTIHSADLKITPQSNEITVSVSDFPRFIKAALETNLMLAQVSIKLNMVSQRLIIDADPLLTADMDDMTLGELDIGQDITFYSI